MNTEPRPSAPSARVLSRRIYVRPQALARLTFSYWSRDGKESELVMTNGVAQSVAVYIAAEEKKRFITEMRAALDEWEAC